MDGRLGSQGGPCFAVDANEVVARFYEEFDSGEIDEALVGFSGELEVIDPEMGTVHGLRRFRQYLIGFKKAMPDAHAVIERMFDADDSFIVGGRFVGTNTGPLATEDGETEPTGEKVDLRFVDISRVRDGQVISYHTYYDQLTLLTQLGLMPADG